jgi:ADP-heptose:LPS heptosyltransferase
LRKNLTKNTEMRLLVIRTSSMGDVALTTPVLSGMRKQYSDVELVMVTRSAFKSFFTSIDGIRLFCPDLKMRHKGFTGLINLYRDISSQAQYDYVIDLHDVLRSRILRLFFRLSGVPVAVLDKGRSEKRYLINGKKKIRLKHTVERYCDVFLKAGFPVRLSDEISIVPSSEALAFIGSIIETQGVLNIGVAPYAKHKLKMWPEEYMAELLRLISEKQKCRFWLFGGMDESERLEAFQTRIEGAVNMAGKLNLDQELTLMSKLDLMISMDSSNMHMAALSGTRVISIWGGTDPMTGFGAWQQPDDFAVRIPVNELECRPCTVYGKGKCRRKDFACMNWLTSERVYEKIEKHILLKHSD